jgi:hypothetical protein
VAPKLRCPPEGSRFVIRLAQMREGQATCQHANIPAQSRLTSGKFLRRPGGNRSPPPPPFPPPLCSKPPDVSNRGPAPRSVAHPQRAMRSVPAWHAEILAHSSRHPSSPLVIAAIDPGASAGVIPLRFIKGKSAVSRPGTLATHPTCQRIDFLRHFLRLREAPSQPRPSIRPSQRWSRLRRSPP